MLRKIMTSNTWAYLHLHLLPCWVAPVTDYISSSCGRTRSKSLLCHCPSSQLSSLATKKLVSVLSASSPGSNWKFCLGTEKPFLISIYLFKKKKNQNWCIFTNIFGFNKMVFPYEKLFHWKILDQLSWVDPKVHPLSPLNPTFIKKQYLGF